MTPPEKKPPAAERPEQSMQDLIRQDLGKFTEAERRVAYALLEDYPTAGLETVAKFARRAKTSGPTILRFVNHLGFDSYAAFQDALRTEIQIRLQGPLTRYGALPETDRGDEPNEKVSQALSRNIELAYHDLRHKMPEIVECLSDPNRNILCIGGRFSWLIASYMHHYLRELRSGVRLVRDNNAAWADYLLDVRPGDIVVVFDFRRYQRDVLEFSKGVLAQKGEIILLTDIWYSPIAAFASIVVRCPVRIPSAFDSGVTGLAMVEIITAGVVDSLGDRARDRIETLESLRNPFKLES